MADQPQIDHVKEFHKRNIANILDMIRLLKVNCVLYVPGNNPEVVPPEAKAYIYSELQSIAKLYEPKIAGVE